MTTTGEMTLEDAVNNYEMYGIFTTMDADAKEIVMTKGEVECRIKI